MKKLFLVSACLMLATPVFAQSIGEKTGVNSALGVTPATADFVKEAAASDMFEIESNKLGQERGNAAQKSFAAMMIKDHMKTSAELKELVTAKNEIPTTMTDAQKSKLDSLKGYQGDDFVSEFNSQQVSAHKDAVSLFERYAKGGEDSKLKDWAGKTLPALQHHLEMAQNLKK
jgi:putative membrane protein